MEHMIKKLMYFIRNKIIQTRIFFEFYPAKRYFKRQSEMLKFWNKIHCNKTKRQIFGRGKYCGVFAPSLQDVITGYAMKRFY